jgi:Ser/Thr protein kinase RdoA (MazF antagonist)
MLTVDNVTDFLLDRRLIDAAWIIDGPLTIRSMARRNRNLVIVGPGTAGFLIKQPYDPAEGGLETLRREALFHGLCREEPTAELMSEVIPRLVDRDLDEAILVFELIPDVVTLLSLLEDPSGWGIRVEAAYGFGQALGAFHRVFLAIDPDDSDRPWLPRDTPAVLELHRPNVARRGNFSRAVSEIFRTVQKSESLGDVLDALRGLWQPESIIHADIKLDNVLVRPVSAAPESDAIEVWIADWELVQVGDPAWDLAGALQDLLVNWVRSMPLNESLGDEAMFARAGLPLAEVQGIARALWSGYREEAGLHPDEADDFLLRAVKFSAARLFQSAYEAAWYEDRMPAVAAMLLRIGEDLLMEPEHGRIILYGITPGPPASAPGCS